MKTKTISRFLAVLCAAEALALAGLCAVFVLRTSAPPSRILPFYMLIYTLSRTLVKPSGRKRSCRLWNRTASTGSGRRCLCAFPSVR